MLSTTFRAITKCPDAFRHSGERREQSQDPIAWLPDDFPLLTVQADRRGKVPAVVEILSTCRQVLDADGVTTGTFSVCAWPNHKQVNAKLQEEKKIGDLLNAIHLAMLQAGAERGSFFRLRHSIIEIPQNDGEPVPIIEIEFAQQPLAIIAERDERVMAQWLWLPSIYNRMLDKLERGGEFAQWLFKLMPKGRNNRWLPTGCQSDPWWDNTDIAYNLDDLIRKGGLAVSHKLWDALMQDDTINREVRATGLFDKVVVVGTRVQKIEGQHAAGSNRTRLLRR